MEIFRRDHLGDKNVGRDHSAELNVAAQEDDVALSSPVGDIVTEMDSFDVTASSTISAGISIAAITSPVP